MTRNINKSIAIAAAAATVIIAAGAPAQAQMSGFKSIAPAAGESQIIHKTGRRGRRGRRVAGAIALGLIGAAIVAGGARAHYDHDYRYSRHQRRCNRWRRWCRNGEDRACWKYDNRC